MMFADFQTWLGEQVLWVVAVILVWGWLIKRALNANPKVQDAAKQAATNKAIDWIGRLSKKW